MRKKSRERKERNRGLSSKPSVLFVAAILGMLLLSVVAALPDDKKEKKITNKPEKGSKVTPNLAGKIEGTVPEEELPVIIFFKKKEKTEQAKIQAQDKVASNVAAKGGKVKHKYKLIDAVSAKVPSGKILELAEDSEVERVYYDEIFSLPPQPSGGEIGVQMANSTQTIGANYAWDVLGYTGTGIKVAVLDTGINYSHADLGGGFGSNYRVIDGYDFVNEDADPIDDNGHGTHVTGTAAANGTIKGVAPNATLLAVKVLNSSGSGTTSDIIAGIDWSATKGADIITMSLGGFSQPNDEFASPITIVADAAVDKGVVVVIAAGNDGPGTGVINHLATGKKVITVGASNSSATVTISDDTIATFSSRGPSAFGRLDPEVVAPGVSINSTSYTGGYALMSGTSMATPHVSGAAALLMEKNASLTPADVRRILMHTAGNLTSSNIHVFAKGAGIINVTKALTYNISATIDGDDRWETSVLPGFNATSKLKITNNNDYAVNFTFDVEGIADLEGYNTLGTSSFSLPENTLVPAGATSTVEINFSAPSNANASIYGTTLTISNASAGTLRIPIVITVPLFGSGTILGTVNDDANYGDWIYYKIKTHNGTSLNTTLSWSGSDNLDLYLFAPSGVTVNNTGGSLTNPEAVTLSNMVYDEYWIAVDVDSLVGSSISYTLNITFPAGTQGNLQVTPSSWQGSVDSNDTKNITFTITNDAFSKSDLNLSVRALKEGDSNFTTDTMSNTGGSYVLATNLSASGMNLTKTRYLNVTLGWDNSSNDLDLRIVYYNGSNWVSTRFESWHNNSQLNESSEKLENVDVQHYLKTYGDVGIGIKNSGATQPYNLTTNLTDIASWDAALVNETTISLSGDAVKEVNVTLNGSSLVEGENYNAVFSIQNKTEDFATVSIKLAVSDVTPPRINITSPSVVEKDAQANHTVTITEPQPNAYKVYKNGSTVANGSYSNGTPFNISIDASQVTMWNYTAWANDTAGNSNQTTVLVTIQDTTPPNITIHSPANASTRDTTPLLNATFGEVVNYTWYNVNSTTNSTPAGDASNLTLNLTQLTDGPHNVTVYANDSSGNLNYSTRYFTVDTAPPKVSGLKPTSGSTVRGVQYINATVTDNSSLSSVAANVSNTTYSKTYVLDQTLGNEYYNNSWDTSQLTDGAYNITINATDSAGNSNSTEYVTVTVDNLPRITIISPENISYSTASIDFNISVSEVLYADGALLSIDGGANASLTNDTTFHWFNTSVPPLSEGQHNATFWVNDTTGNINSSTIWFTVDTTPPALDFQTPTPSNGASLSSGTTSATLNISITESNPASLILNWGGVNTSYSYSGPYWNITKSVSSGNSYSYYVWANDTAGNSNQTSSRSFSVQSGGNGEGGGGGGGGGGGASAVITSGWISKLSPGTTGVTQLSVAESKYVQEVHLTMKQGADVAYNIRIDVGTLNNKPDVPEAPGAATGEVYKYFEINKYGILDIELRMVTIKFRVEKIWLKNNSMEPASVTMYRFYSEDLEWKKLETAIDGEDNDYFLYAAKSPKLSYLVITGLKGTLKETSPEPPSTREPQVTPLPVEPPEEIQPPLPIEAEAIPEEKPEDVPSTEPFQTMMGVAVILLTGGIMYWARKRLRKPVFTILELRCELDKLKEIEKIVGKHGCVISSITPQEEQAIVDLVIRVPMDKTRETLKELEDFGKIDYKSPKTIF